MKQIKYLAQHLERVKGETYYIDIIESFIQLLVNNKRNQQKDFDSILKQFKRFNLIGFELKFIKSMLKEYKVKFTYVISHKLDRLLKNSSVINYEKSQRLEYKSYSKIKIEGENGSNYAYDHYTLRFMKSYKMVTLK